MVTSQLISKGTAVAQTRGPGTKPERTTAPESSCGQRSSVTWLLIRQDEEQDYESLHCLTANSLAIITDLRKQGSTQGMIQFNKQTASLLLLGSS